MDESNDVSTTKNLMIYMQFVNKHEKKLEVRFMKLLPLKECDASSITKCIVYFLHQNSIPLDKMILFTSDGAAVMLGANNGVHVKLKEQCGSHLVEYHCVAHREPLAVSQAYSSIAYFVRLENILKSIYSHFSHSSCRIEKLKEIFDLLDQKFLRVRKLHDVRWLSRYEAVNTIVKTYTPLLVYFEDVSQSDVVAEGLAKQMTTYRFVFTIHFLLDVLSTMAQLSKIFQIHGYHPYSAIQKVDEVCLAFDSRYLNQNVRWGPHASSCIEQIDKGELPVTSSNRMRGGEDVTERRQAQQDAVNFVKLVVQNLRSRFPKNDLFQAAVIFDPSRIPSSCLLMVNGK